MAASAREAPVANIPAAGGTPSPLNRPAPLNSSNAAAGRREDVSCDDELEPLRIARRKATSAFELKYLQALLSRSGGSISRAAAISKVSRQMLQKLMRKHGVTISRR